MQSLTDTAYIPKETSSLKLHSLRDLYLDAKDITVHGDNVQSCSTSEDPVTTTTAAPSKSKTPERFKVS